jgi:hypothetical protein
MARDFERSAKIVMSLVRVDLALGRDADAQESIRMALCEASEVGRTRNTKLCKAFGDGRQTPMQKM